MDVSEIKELLIAASNADVSELVLETGDYKLTIKRGSAEPVAQVAPAPAQQQQPAEPKQETPSEPKPEPSEPKPDKNLSEITAPIVGTFYEAPSPDAAPYVKVGDKVEAGAVLCIIEAMKLMNEIEAEVSGTVAEILVKNEEPVEYGQPLFRIDPS